jgi:hypothetical protein
MDQYRTGGSSNRLMRNRATWADFTEIEVIGYRAASCFEYCGNVCAFYFLRGRRFAEDYYESSLEVLWGNMGDTALLTIAVPNEVESILTMR